MKRAEIATALAMLTLSAIVVLGTRDLPYWTEFAPGGRFAPIWIAAITAALSIALLIAALQRKTPISSEWPDARGMRRVGLIVGGLWLVLGLSPILGLIPMIVAFILFMLLIVLGAPWPQSVATTVVTAALIYGVFVAWLGISLPVGIFGL